MSTEQRAAKRKLNRDIGELLTVAKHCFNARRIAPGLILLYATIDILASLDRPESKEDVTRDDFVSWVDAFVLPGSSLGCSAIDLYAARCGLLHTYAPGSRLSRLGLAKEVYYAWGIAKAEKLEELMKQRSWDIPAIAVHINKLLKAVEGGFEDFRRVLGRDPKRASRVYDRAQKFFGPMSADLVSLSLLAPPK